MTMGKHDWGLVAAGFLLVVCSLVFLFAPGLTLVTITVIAGASFLVAGVFDVIGYFRMRKVAGVSGWELVYGVLDVVMGALLVVHPLTFAAVIPWLVGAAFAVFGGFEVAAAFKARRLGMGLWGLPLFSGIVGVLCGVMFFAVPTALPVFLSVFILMRGASLLVYGWNAGKALL